MTRSIRTLVPILKAQFQGPHDIAIVDAVSIDSRSLQNGPHTLFFALRGPNHDGHDFLETVYTQGVTNFVVQRVPEALVGKANFLIVPDTLVALQQLATAYRSEFSFPIIGVTGSNGKTIVKEWLNFLLSPDYHIIRSPKSYNSQVGVPLSVLGINEKHNLGIFEAGISTVDEMVHLQKIIQPTLGILTNIGSAHDEGFQSAGEKIKEKLKLFSAVELLILNKNRTIEAFLPSTIRTFTWSSDDKKADVFVMADEQPDYTELRITYQKQCFKVVIPFSDFASIENAMHCLMVLLYLRYDEAVIQERMAQLYPVEMRLKVKNGQHQTRLIDDSYSSDFQSLKIALDFLESQQQFKKKTLILSDIFQSGLDNDALYAQVSLLVVSNHINRVIAIGPTISAYKRKFPNCLAFPSTQAFLDVIDTLVFEQETILIKGARHFHFEDIVTVLEEKTHETVLEINLNAISHNLNFYKAKLHSPTKLMVMVKAFSYGNGGYEIAKLLAHHKVDYLGVAFADEGVALKQAGIQLPIMVLNPESTSYPSLIQHGLEPEIYSLKGLHAFVKLAEQKKLKRFPIHIKLDTGMHRLGFMEQDIPALIARLQQTQAVEVKSILSHLAASDDMTFVDFTLAQLSLFEDLSTQLMEALNIQPIRHILNTSGISNFGQAQYDMVRLGIGLYGISNDEDEQKLLEQVATLKSVISQIRVVEPGESVGYSRRFMAERLTRVATVPIGYADGISRHWGNGKGYVVINGKRATILGSICMDMLMVDVTDIDCKEGHEVIVFGKDPSVIHMAQVLETIPYEIMTSISQRVKRIFYRE
ncbi:bifunctional UDP-N-acetylmuramoyl-tripeptide:D-alanyl-D-alanine ligase/alanine racemase [Flavobacterium sp.]|uniref:bifunctional UDP-N-acetylmuramoyl-tripeptide:D-alanyl-D-alanine ligase/alanine racemase n=1 Tax=Flavobacterium sp. TaxID=239 RepID=UPI0022C1E273|nr:bifunctional UDP-N-acetylmuramoyl-tripeptide:D-alanyl-D-alanine ligase/alanine racemase [Flavobacterium sp.]MCZ8366862.1 bifunctional UDP-N-acetylmuramoyl-tripeptide:D-alanyl-D-alanine ligase/alanine racemase [Flavobacterium sp.]